MTRHLTDRQRVEQLLFIDQLAHVVREGAADVREPETARTLQALGRARAETEAGLTGSERDKMGRRLRRVDAEAFAPLRREGSDVAAFGLVIFCLMRDLAETGYLAPVPGSQLAQALARILPALQSTADRPGTMDRAEIDAKRALRALEAAGYLAGWRTGTDR